MRKADEREELVVARVEPSLVRSRHDAETTTLAFGKASLPRTALPRKEHGRNRAERHKKKGKDHDWVRSMNEGDRGKLGKASQDAFHRDAQQHTFQYWLVLSSRNIAMPARPLAERGRTVPRLDPVDLIGADIDDRSGWTWEQHFAHETNPAHPRAKSRKMPRSVGRHYTFWTQQELLDVHAPHYLRQVAKANQGPVSYGYWAEIGKWDGRPHLHIHLGGSARVSLLTLRNIWKGMNGGRAEIRYFDKSKDTGYNYKYVATSQIDAYGREHELLWRANYWKPDRTHNSTEQARLFRELQGGT